MFGAIKQSNGLYSIVECYPYLGKTFSIKKKLKDLGGSWSGENKRWENIKEEDLSKIPASKRIKVRIAANCHEPEKDIFCLECEIKDEFLRVSCSLCDTGYSSGMRAKVINIYGEIVL